MLKPADDQARQDVAIRRIGVPGPKEKRQRIQPGITTAWLIRGLPVPAAVPRHARQLVLVIPPFVSKSELWLLVSSL